jgi:hypothetical protein
MRTPLLWMAIKPQIKSRATLEMTQTTEPGDISSVKATKMTKRPFTDSKGPCKNKSQDPTQWPTVIKANQSQIKRESRTRDQRMTTQALQKSSHGINFMDSSRYGPNRFSNRWLSNLVKLGDRIGHDIPKSALSFVPTLDSQRRNSEDLTHSEPIFTRPRVHRPTLKTFLIEYWAPDHLRR